MNHNPSSRRENHRAAGAPGHPIDDAADDAYRGSLRGRTTRNRGLHVESDHGRRGGLRDGGHAFGTEHGSKGGAGIRGGFEHRCTALGEPHHGGHNLVQGGRLVHGGTHAIQVEGHRSEPIPGRRHRNGHHRHLWSDPGCLKLRDCEDELTPNREGGRFALRRRIAMRRDRMCLRSNPRFHEVLERFVERIP